MVWRDLSQSECWYIEFAVHVQRCVVIVFSICNAQVEKQAWVTVADPTHSSFLRTSQICNCFSLLCSHWRWLPQIFFSNLKNISWNCWISSKAWKKSCVHFVVLSGHIYYISIYWSIKWIVSAPTKIHKHTCIFSYYFFLWLPYFLNEIFISPSCRQVVTAVLGFTAVCW